ncbi:MAG: hypothetical protein ACRCY4_04595 [Brevinema sp.]
MLENFKKEIFNLSQLSNSSTLKRWTYSILSSTALIIYIRYFFSYTPDVVLWPIALGLPVLFFYLTQYSLYSKLDYFLIFSIPFLVFTNEDPARGQIYGATYSIAFVHKKLLFILFDLTAIFLLHKIVKKYASKINVFFISLFAFLCSYFLMFSPFVFNLHHYNAHFGVMRKVFTESFGTQLYSTYGHFPYLLYPFFKLVGLNTTTYGHMLAFLCALSVAGSIIVLYKLVKSSYLRIIGSLAILFFSTVFIPLWFGNYFAMFPIRTIFPVFAMLYSFFLFKHQDHIYSWLGAMFLTAFAIVWNPETGLAILIGFSGIYVYLKNYMLPLKDFKFYLSIFVAFIGAVLTIALGWLILNIGSYLIAGATQSLKELLFPLLTNFPSNLEIRLPLGMPELWIFFSLLLASIFLYCIKNSYFFSGTFQETTQEKSSLLFIVFITVIIYLYYINRSASGNQFVVAFPAVVLLTWIVSKTESHSVYFVRVFSHCGSVTLLLLGLSFFTGILYSPRYRSYIETKHTLDASMYYVKILHDKYGQNGLPAMGSPALISYANLGITEPNPLDMMPEDSSQLWAVPPEDLLQQFIEISPEMFLLIGLPPLILTEYIQSHYTNLLPEIKDQQYFIMKKISNESIQGK